MIGIFGTFRSTYSIFPLCGITGYNVWYVVFTSINRLHISQMWKLSCPGILSDFLCHIIFMKVVYGPYYGKHSVSNYIIYINDERLHLYLSSPVFEPINEDLADICFSSNWCFKKVFRPFSRKIVIVSGQWTVASKTNLDTIYFVSMNCRSTGRRRCLCCRTCPQSPSRRPCRSPAGASCSVPAPRYMA